MRKPYNGVSTRKTVQTDPVLDRNQIKNNAGGYVFSLDIWKRLDRFLILGSEGGTYYVTEQKLTEDNTTVLLSCIENDGIRAVNAIVDISVSGRNPKQSPILFALAMCASLGDKMTRQVALSHLSDVCRTATQLFEFLEYAQQFRGWGRSLRRSVAAWYTDKTRHQLELQVAKYQSRNGWTHADAIKLSHPKKIEYNDIFKFILGGDDVETHDVIHGMLLANKAENVSEIIKIIDEYKLPRECIPTKFLNEPDVWRILLRDMPLTAMIRNLGKMTQVGLLKPLSDDATLIAQKLTSEEHLLKARVHPFSVLLALRTYKDGHGFKGTLRWSPIASIVDALDNAFYLSFGNVNPTGKRIMLALDVSGSMVATLLGSSLSCREASAAMALITAKTESSHVFVGFTSEGGSYYSLRGTGIDLLNISPRMRLDNVIEYVESLNFGGTDCALPMIYAQKHDLSIDAFVIYTDSETWAGKIHPFQALNEYRKTSGIDAKLVVVGMTSTGFTIADPTDPGMLDVVGFDSATPQVISDFISGNI